MNIKETFVSQCLDIIKREDIKYELKGVFLYIIQMILIELKPYIYITIFLGISIFVMVLAILIIMVFILRNKNLIKII